LEGGSSTITAEGTFEIKGLAGPRIFRVSGIPAGWILKAVRVNGNDITDHGIDIKPNEPIGGVEVVLTSKTTEVTGAVKAGNDPHNQELGICLLDDYRHSTAADRDRLLLASAKHTAGHRKYGSHLDAWRRYADAFGLARS
jgi:hypothetical protein